MIHYDIHKLIQLIPESTENEALLSIQSIRIEPPRSARLTCHLSKKFFIIVEINRAGEISINGKGSFNVDCFLTELKKEIYVQDELPAPTVHLKKKVAFTPSPPPDMDIPVWDSETNTWYDAEY